MEGGCEALTRISSIISVIYDLRSLVLQKKRDFGFIVSSVREAFVS